MPNLVATTTCSRRPRNAFPRYSSLFLPPHISAVSRKLTPASSAACTTLAVASASRRQPKLLHPRPTTETCSEPILRFSMNPLLYYLRIYEWMQQASPPIHVQFLFQSSRSPPNPYASTTCD